MLPEDGWPLEVLVTPATAASFQATALALLRQGLIGVYACSTDAAFLPFEDAEAALGKIENWLPFDPPENLARRDPDGWFICTTPEGDAVLDSLRSTP